MEQIQGNLRPLTPSEQSILVKLLSEQFQGRDALVKQAHESMATDTGDPDNYGSILLTTSSTEPAQVSKRVPVEGRLQDSDGIPVEVLLHVVDGFLSELEVVKADGTPLNEPVEAGKIFVQIN